MADRHGCPLVYVAASPIHGLGVFARRRIARGSYLGCYEGEKTQRDGTYVLWVQGSDENEWTGYEGTNKLRYLNHSPAPNSEMDGRHLYAARDIGKNEEVTIDYGEWFEVD